MSTDISETTETTEAPDAIEAPDTIEASHTIEATDTTEATGEVSTDSGSATSVAAPAKKKKKKKAKSATKAASAPPAAPPAPSLRAQLTENLHPRRHPVIVGLVALSVAALVATTVLGILLSQRSDQLSAAEQLAADKAAAERVAGDYAVGAATFDFRDLTPWSTALKKGTAPELTSRFDVAVKTLTPLIQEVQWNQTARLIAATTVDVRADRQFVVQVFVSTHMTSTQNPAGLNTVTPYTVTLDRDDNWLITDVAGIADAAQDGSTGTGTPDLAPADSAAPSQAPATPGATSMTPAPPTP
ncbi:serine/threonine protein kinase [Gordonia sp. NPDC003950]